MEFFACLSGPDSSVGFISVQVNTSLGVCPELPCQFYRGDDVIATITFEVPCKDQEIFFNQNIQK